MAITHARWALMGCQGDSLAPSAHALAVTNAREPSTNYDSQHFCCRSIKPEVQWRKYMVFITKLFLFTILISSSLSTFADIRGISEDLGQHWSRHKEK